MRVSTGGNSVDSRLQLMSKSGKSVLPAFEITKVSLGRDVHDNRYYNLSTKDFSAGITAV